MNWEIILALIGAMGGLEAMKWLLTRRSGRRLEMAAAASAESEVEQSREKLQQETLLFLQQQLKEKELRFAEQTDLLRKTTQEVLTLTRQVGELQMQLAARRCDRLSCPDREPPLIN